MLRVISADVYEVVGGRPVRCIGVAARVAALAPSAWEVSATIRGLPADTLACGTLARLTASDRESPLGLIRSGTQRACGSEVTAPHGRVVWRRPQAPPASPADQDAAGTRPRARPVRPGRSRR